MSRSVKSVGQRLSCDVRTHHVHIDSSYCTGPIWNHLPANGTVTALCKGRILPPTKVMSPAATLFPADAGESVGCGAGEFAANAVGDNAGTVSCGCAAVAGGEERAGFVAAATGEITIVERVVGAGPANCG
jgi:hypothetical protein